MIAGRPTEVEIPEVVRALAAGQPIRPVWRNELGGLTFALGPGDGDRYVKWTPPDSGIDLGREAARLAWAATYLPVPRLLGQGGDESGSWLVTSAIAGTNAVEPRWLGRPALVATALGSDLRRLHEALPVAECPFSWSAAERRAAVTARQGVLDPAEWHAEHAGQPIPLLLRQLADPPPDDRLVVCHGDACAPNTLLGPCGEVVGYVDLGSLGVADRWADLAVASWSLGWNYGQGYEPAFFAGYGIEPDADRIAYYRLLWDLAE